MAIRWCYKLEALTTGPQCLLCCQFIKLRSCPWISAAYSSSLVCSYRRTLYPGMYLSLPVHSVFKVRCSVISVLGAVPITGLIVQLLPCDFLIKFDRFLRFCLSILIGTIFLLSLTVRTHVLTFNQAVHQGIHCGKNNLFIFL